MNLDSPFFQSGSFLATDQEVYWSELQSSHQEGSRAFDVPDKTGVWIQTYFDKQNSPFFEVPNWQKDSYSIFLSKCSDLKLANAADKASQSNSWVLPNFEDFKVEFDRVGDLIQVGQIKKGVPITFSYSSDVPNVSQILSWIQNAIKAAQSNLNLIAYGWWSEGQGIIGVTPEILIKKKSQVLSTVALAGTRALDAEASRLPLLQDQKELREHKIVIEDIQKQLDPLGQLVIGPTCVTKLPTLEHLKTEIQFIPSRPRAFIEYVQILHPTAALGIYPRKADVWQDLASLPNQALRRHFGGPITFNFGEHLQISLVMIRNIQWDLSGQKIFAGVGQIAESLVEREWQEACDKIEMTQKLLLRG